MPNLVWRLAGWLAAGTPAAAEGFLKDLAEGCREHADRELAGLTQLKRAHTGNAGMGAGRGALVAIVTHITHACLESMPLHRCAAGAFEQTSPAIYL